MNKKEPDPINSIPITVARGWNDYELLDSGDGVKLERYGKIILVRPEPEAFWMKSLPEQEWKKADAVYLSPSQDEKWYLEISPTISQSLDIQVGSVRCKSSFPLPDISGFFRSSFRNGSGCMITSSTRNTHEGAQLFGYTGMATLIAAQAGAQVTHVDASKKAVSWAKTNQEISGLQEKPVRWIVDDALKFVKREARRQNSYDVIVLVLPSSGWSQRGGVGIL
jgi:23S rRNA (cytosine1962-C5)-methyltransferase